MKRREPARVLKCGCACACACERASVCTRARARARAHVYACAWVPGEGGWQGTACRRPACECAPGVCARAACPPRLPERGGGDGLRLHALVHLLDRSTELALNNRKGLRAHKRRGRGQRLELRARVEGDGSEWITR
eukprot:303462-Pleurochrysis_carterae.AAC.1